MIQIRPVSDLRNKFPEIEAIAQISRATVNSLVNKGILKILEEKVQRNPLASKNININKKLKLTEEQKAENAKNVLADLEMFG